MSIKYPKVNRAISTPPMILTRKLPVKVERATPGYYNNLGRWIEGSRETIVIEANVQPARGYELMVVPEADRTEDWIKIYSVDKIRTSYEGVDGASADIIIWDNKRFVAKIQQTYEMGVLNHTKTLAVRLPVINGNADA